VEMDKVDEVPESVYLETIWKAGRLWGYETASYAFRVAPRYSWSFEGMVEHVLRIIYSGPTDNGRIRHITRLIEGCHDPDQARRVFHCGLRGGVAEAWARRAPAPHIPRADKSIVARRTGCLLRMPY